MPRKKSYDESSPNPFGVKIGQIWEDCDPRQGGRRVVVLSVREEDSYRFAMVKTPCGRIRRVQLARFRERTNGYRLVKDT
jgi:hypothetical protein